MTDDSPAALAGSLTPTQLADLDQVHAGAQEALDALIEAHRVEVARHGEILATAYLELHLAEQSHDVAAGFAAHAVTRLVQVTTGPLNPQRELPPGPVAATGPAEPLDLTALEALADAATEGPWEVTRDADELDNTTVRAAASWFEDYGHRLYGVRFIVELAEGNINEADAEFIAAARKALPDLLAEVRRLTAELVRVEADLASLGHWWCPNCEAVADVIDDDFCLRCSSQVEWAEPETLTSVKAYAAKLKRARDEAWAARDAANADLAQVTVQRDDALQMLGDLKPEGLARPRVQLLVWDWREQLDLAKLARLVADLSGGQLHLIDVEDTGTQDYAIVLSTAPLDQEAATEAYRRHREGEPMPAG